MTKTVHPEMDKIPLVQQIAEVERELALRRRVYPKWVESGKMKQIAADLQMARLTAVRDTLKYLADPSTTPERKNVNVQIQG